jgi:anti-repressor protein
MNEMKIFENVEFGKIGIIAIDGKQYFSASECAKMLGYSNPRKAISDHCRCVTKRDVPHPQNPDKTIGVNFISEGDLYRLISRSKLPLAEKFESWVFDEVLPDIRKYGMYAKEELLDDPDLLLDVITKYKQERDIRKQLESKIEIDAPKVVFAEAVASASNSILVRDMAKILNQNGIDIGEKRLYQWFRDNGYVNKYSNTPTQQSLNLSIMEVKEYVRVNYHNQEKIVTFTTKITGKGQIYFVNKFLKLKGGE